MVTQALASRTMSKADILIFDVGLGQSIFFYPHDAREYSVMIDCGNTQDFEPIDFLLKQKYIQNGTLPELTLTNYDQDHFSGLPYLQSKVRILSVLFAENLSSEEIKALKTKPHTQALLSTLQIKDTYTVPRANYAPAYSRVPFTLAKNDLQTLNTNNLSQVVFIEYLGSVICISGDLEAPGWTKLIATQPAVKTWLAKTNIFIASHHGRTNGYSPEVFDHCKPECIIISDKGVVHDTQQNMSSVYGGHVVGDGVPYKGDAINKRKVLTTRDSGHLWVQLLAGGVRTYQNFTT
jgi:beta-lactamase superfamily II metal-dependent hydrolase